MNIFEDVTLTAKRKAARNNWPGFFLRRPACDSGSGHGIAGWQHKTARSQQLEFAALDHAIFDSALPLEFDDRVRLEAAEGIRQPTQPWWPCNTTMDEKLWQ